MTQGALAAAGQARLTGRLGVCAGTTGPGRSQAPGDQEAAPDGRVVGRSKGNAELGSGRRELFLPLRSYFANFWLVA
jgi:hypothetical protein